jgi:hypothetical protein
MFDGDFDVLGPERSEINGFQHHWLFRRRGHPCLTAPGGSSSLLDQFADWLVDQYIIHK